MRLLLGRADDRFSTVLIETEKQQPGHDWIEPECPLRFFTLAMTRAVR